MAEKTSTKTGTEDRSNEHSSKPDEGLGSNYLGAMKIATQMIEMSDDYNDLLVLLNNVGDIVRGDRIEAIFPQIE